MSDAPGLRIALAGLFAGGLLAGIAGPAPAQPIDMIASPGAAGLPPPVTADFEVGRVEYAGTVELVVRPKNSNKTWYLYVRTDDADLGGYGKPVDDLLWRVDGAGPWRSVDAVEQLVATGKDDDSVLLDVAMALDWSLDVPDTYAGDLVFRVTHNP